MFILCGSASTLRQWWIMIKDNRARNSVYVGGSSTRQLVPISGPVPANREMNIIELISLENGFDRTRY